ncbi:MAG: hypothetical protein CM1200mP16_05740 [Nitrospina sp.]|nr:MAG: hypothetical protein CM1200mP16_05740 [Nitrospina sp.]
MLYKQGMTTEILSTFQPAFQYFSEWWKQLVAKVKGKNPKGIFPASVEFTKDLHSMGPKDFKKVVALFSRHFYFLGKFQSAIENTCFPKRYRRFKLPRRKNPGSGKPKSI